MNRTAWRIGLWLAVAAGAAWPQEPPPRAPHGGRVAPAAGERIAWYAQWEQARAEAERLGKPILLVSAAPHCHATPGLW